MKREVYKQQFPEEYAGIVAEGQALGKAEGLQAGIERERQRVTALLKVGETLPTEMKAHVVNAVSDGRSAETLALEMLTAVPAAMADHQFGLEAARQVAFIGGKNVSPIGVEPRNSAETAALMDGIKSRSANK